MPAAPRPPLPGGPYLVAGMARSGVAAARALRALGAEVTGTDSRPLDPLVAAELRGAGVAVADATDGVALLDAARTVVKSPGVPKEAPLIAAARARGLTVIGELELAWRLLPNEFVAVTGSNGKTTTVELLGHLHREAGLAGAVAGNVGTALSSLAGALDPAVTVVCEASSFQLEDAVDFAPEAAVLLNLAPDHLDRHGTFEDYRAAKLRIFARQGPGAVAVLPDDFDASLAPGAARRVTFGTDPGAGLADRDGRLWWAGEPLLAVEEVRLRGLHNRRNAMAAAAVALARGVDIDAVRAGLRTFAGVAHRLEEVGRRGGVLFVNDSKATNVEAAVTGIGSFPGGVHAILGGRGKGQDFGPLAVAVRRTCAAAYLIGEDAPALAAALDGAGVPVHSCGDLERAVAAAAGAARDGEVVLLVPACASFDQYRDFEERGEHFRALATAAGAR